MCSVVLSVSVHKIIFFIEDLALNYFHQRILVSHVPYMINIGGHFFNNNLDFHILKGEVVYVTFDSRFFLFLNNIFDFIPQGKFMRDFNFS
jgi:hypothetical protein